MWIVPLILLLLAEGIDVSTPSTSNVPSDITQKPLVHVTYATHTFRLPETIPKTNIVSTSFAYGSQSHQFYARINYDQSPLHRFSMESGEHTSFPVDPMPKTTRLFAEDPSTGGLLFWDESVGQVFTMTQQGEVTRIDDSFTHRNQYGHAPWIDQDGSIYAFGGYGLFTSKSVVTYFSKNRRSWSLLSIHDTTNEPPAQSRALAISDLVRNQVFIVASTRDFNPDPQVNVTNRNLGVWRLITDDGRWEYLSEIPWERNTASQAVDAMHPSGDFFLLPVVLPNTTNGDIIAYFPETRTYIRMGEIGIRTGANDGVFKVFWSDTDQAFYFAHRHWLVSHNVFIITLNRLTIPDPAAFTKAYGQAEIHAQSVPVVRYVFIAVLLLMTIAIHWYRKRRDVLFEEELAEKIVESDQRPELFVDNSNAEEFSPNNDVAQDAGSADKTSRYSVKAGYDCRVTGPDESGYYHIVSPDGTDIPVESENEIKLLSLLLAHRAINGGRFTSSDEVDALLIPEHPSADYIRRVRNITVKRLSELFDETGTPELLFRRKMKSDKRKVEYRLSEKVQTED